MNKLKEKRDNLVNQKKQIKLEISDCEDALLSREELLQKINGGIEVLEILLNENKEDKEEKKEK